MLSIIGNIKPAAPLR